jgi:purine-cytosine permease-like protein
VIGYQVSWILMFADYSRFTRSVRGGTTAVFLGLALTSLWFMPLGLIAARAASSVEPGAMLAATGLSWWSAVLLTLATVTTNFVNIYLSSLAWKTLVPRSGDQASVWSIGIIAAALSLFSGAWLARFADFTVALGSVLVPVGGVLLAHYFILRRPTPVADLYDLTGPLARHGGWAIPGLAAWAAGIAAYYAARPIGSTLPALTAAIVVYVVADRITSSAVPSV